MYDQQRMHFKRLEDSARDNYVAQQKAMEVSVAQTMMQQADHKKNAEAALKADHVQMDQTDLARTNASFLPCSETMRAGMTAKSFGC